MKSKIVLFDVHNADQDTYRQALGAQFEVVITDLGLSADTVKLAADAEVVAVHVTSPVTAQMLKLMPKVKHVACRSTGIDHVDLAYAKQHDITVSYVPSYGENTVAEYTFMLLLAVSRRLMLATHSIGTGAVEVEQLTGHDLSGKALGVIGTGKIGMRVAAIGRGFGMTVAAYDLYPNERAAKDIGFEYLALDDLLSRADCISLHAPATPETHHLLNKGAFGRMKPGVLIVNTARGQLIDTPALIEALVGGQVGGAGLDVLEGEEYLAKAPEIRLLESKAQGDDAKQALAVDRLTKMPNVLITDHNAYNSVEALGRIRDTTIANVLAWHKQLAENLVA